MDEIWHPLAHGVDIDGKERNRVYCAVVPGIAATVTREVGGPGLLTAEAAWQSPTLPVADGAICVRPRSARLPEQQQSEFAVACANR